MPAPIGYRIDDEMRRLMARHEAWWAGRALLVARVPSSPLADLWLPLSDGTVAAEDVDLQPGMLDLDRLAGTPQPPGPLERDGDRIRSQSAFVRVPWVEAIMGCPIRASIQGGAMRAHAFVSDWRAWGGGAAYRRDDWLEALVALTERLAAASGGRYAVTHTLMRGPVDLAEAALDPLDGRTCDIPLADGAEYQRVVYDFNDTSAEFPRDKTLHELFEKRAEKTPDNIAVKDAKRSLTYGELNAFANRLAHLLIDRGVGRETLVGLCLERGVELSAAILGIHKAGGAYVPLDPRYPAERFALLCRDAGLRHMVATTATAPPFNGELLLLDQIDLAAFPDHNPAVPVAADNLAYVIYTSGSTGRPKGVMVEHRGVVNRLFWLHHGLPYSPADVIMQKTPVTFDVSVPELYGGFPAGASVYMLEPGAEKDPPRIVETIEEHGVTSIHFVASMLAAFLDHLQAVPGDIHRCRTLNRVFTSGEAVSRGLVERYNRILRPATDAGLHDLYGPTEGTIEVSWYPCPESTPAVKTIGRPVANTSLYVLDAQGHPQPTGVAGELCIGGVQVARGYLHQPELTAARFVSNPFAPGRLYKTGDLARWLLHGEIEYLGRIDHQVKIRGFRIELGEIESALREHPQVTDVLVHPFGEKGEQRLCAYVVGDFEAAELRRHLSARLPDYMVPAAFVKLDAIPLTASGKADRKNLPHPEFQSKAAFTPPRTETEETLCSLFASVLAVDRIGIHDNFFEAGGDSILALQVISRARGLGIDLAVRDLFKAPDVENLAARARRLDSAGGVTAAGEAPLTPIQKWFFSQEGDKNHFNQSLLLCVPAGLDLARLNQAMGRVVEHHDALRLRFTDGKQSLLGRDAFIDKELVRRIDCSSWTSAERKAILSEEGEKAQTSLDIEKGDLFRCLWFDYGSEEPGRLLWIIHHLAVDGVSWRILIPDLQAAYEEKPLPDAATPWTTWAARLAETVSARAREFPLWRDIANYSGQLLRRNAPAATTHDEGFTIELGAEETRHLLTAAPAAYRANAEDLLLASLCLGLERWTGTPLDDGILINLEGHGRENLIPGADPSRTVGWFTALYPVKLRTGRDLRDTLIGIKEALRAIPDRGVGYGLLRYFGHEELVCAPQVSFNYLGRFTNLENPDLWNLAEEDHGRPVASSWKQSVLLDINAVVAGDKLRFHLTWPTDVFTGEAMDQLRATIQGALVEVLNHCRGASPTFTPADFPLVRIPRETLSGLQEKYPGLRRPRRGKYRRRRRFTRP